MLSAARGNGTQGDEVSKKNTFDGSLAVLHRKKSRLDASLMALRRAKLSVISPRLLLDNFLQATLPASAR
ncbi:hypothetical protein D9758_004929 [Tetrapyrgos nigripes]|uniref:Uncharacterized protein n=1 Tax=Tetrapyrgos nigripes TaxID=182062 RepID=A0A8H5GW73_9AGAR|nr:hypothetical protein D9758_016548 [Tetrapyrgos nigripes]KAF5372107.1 hypothetical protein D9758_004929 [Tetrapyrgos nigripes]